MKELMEIIELRRRSPWIPYALATVLRVEGSSYRRPGARMLVDVGGRVAGSVSGGCLEKSVISQAQLTLVDGRSRLLTFDTTDQDDIAFGASMGCQGMITIGIELLAPGQNWALEDVVQQVRHRRKPCALLTRLVRDGEEISFLSAAAFRDYDFVSARFSDAVEEVFRTRKSRFVEEDEQSSVLIEWLAPPLSLLVFGAGPDALPMVRLGHELGHEVTVIDRRFDFAVPGHFPGAAHVLCAKSHELTDLVDIDERTAAVLMNHHYDTDRDVLSALLPLGLPYLALLGPRRRTARILTELRQTGMKISEEEIHFPAGLDIGAESPEEIALSILAEIQASLAGRDGEELKHRCLPIHEETLAA